MDDLFSTGVKQIFKGILVDSQLVPILGGMPKIDR